ncbi:hypothetical protein PQU96_02360 [Vogesella sp. LYT5W]|uniref:Secreted protein n=1 Tax=Vogesella margarita TaxID=2984199 RepID=A0ABT5IKB3_9NEIS|nr:hypothetical protein [Vogesella margarita]MDC7712978.1 hypothetical protein [Vogesella margarita]
MKALSRRQWQFVALALLVFAALKVALITWYLQHRQPAAPAVTSVSCSTLQQGCTLPDGSVLRFADAPRQRSPFTLTLSKQGSEAPTAEFSMQDMDMGFNRYRFVDGGDHWQARVTLPACVSGSPDWLLDLHQGDHTYRIAFRAG